MKRQDLEEIQQIIDAGLKRLTLPPDVKVILGLIPQIVIAVVAPRSGAEPARDDASEGEVDQETSPVSPRPVLTGIQPELLGELDLLLGRALDRYVAVELAKELRWESEQANENLCRAARLASQAGAPSEQITAAVREYLVQHVALEQRLIETMLNIPRRAEANGRSRRRAGVR